MFRIPVKDQMKRPGEMRELVMHWRRRGIRVLPFLDDYMFMERGFSAMYPVGAPGGKGPLLGRSQDQCA